MTTTSYTVNAICLVTVSVTVQDCETWKEAAKKAANELQESVEINSVSDFEIYWQKITEDQCADYSNDEWQVTQVAEISMCVDVQATDWKDAAKQAVEIAQNGIEIISNDNVDIDWQHITEDMVVKD